MTIDPRSPDPQAIQAAADILARGGLVAFPTETVYGVGAAIPRPDAIARIFAVKRRPADRPITVHLADASQATPLIRDWPASAKALTQHYWPGPLTIIVPRSPHTPDIVTAGGDGVGLRVPDNAVAGELMRRAGPLAATSANHSENVPPTRADHVLAELDGEIDLVLDAGPTLGGLESTVIDLSVQPPRILRRGPVPESELGRYVEGLASPGRREQVAGDGGRTDVAPGRAYNAAHATHGLVRLMWCHAAQIPTITERNAVWLLRSARVDAPRAAVIRLPNDPQKYTSALYEALRGLDGRRSGRVVVELPPDEEAWRAARDRVLRHCVPYSQDA